MKILSEARFPIEGRSVLSGMNNSTFLLLVVVMITGTVYLTKSPGPGLVAVPQTAPEVRVTAGVVASPSTLQKYTRMPNGALVPVVEQTAQEYQEQVEATSPLAAPKAANRHTTDDLINSVNNGSL